MINIKTFNFNPIQVNTYILYDETKECVIIDPACSNNREEKILSDFIEENKLKPIYILNTHCHFDHIMGNAYIKNKYNSKIFINKNEEEMLNNAVEYGLLFGIEAIKSPKPDGYLEENDIIKFGNSSLTVLFSPGHSEGSLLFFSKENNFIIVGDVLFLGSIGRTDLPGGDHYSLINNIKDKIFTLKDNVTVYPGHGDKTNVGFEKATNRFFI